MGGEKNNFLRVNLAADTDTTASARSIASLRTALTVNLDYCDEWLSGKDFKTLEQTAGGLEILGETLAPKGDAAAWQQGLAALLESSRQLQAAAHAKDATAAATLIKQMREQVTALPAPGGKPQPPARGAKKAAADTAAPVPPVNLPVSFTVNGRTIDIQAYTRFLRQLEASPWVTDVTPVSAQTVIEKERPVTAFTIRATYRQADSAYIRTVPLSQSVR